MARWFVDRSPQHGIPSVSLRSVLPDAHFPGCRDLVVSGCSADSRRLDPGQVFVAVPGSRYDGHSFVNRAIERGAAAVVVERPCPEAGRLQVVVPDARRAHARLCQALAGRPSELLPIIGVAGCRGRTATALFLRSIFEATGSRFGMVGSLGWSDGVNACPPGATEPGSEELAEMLVAMIERGCAGGILELSPTSLARQSLDGMTFETAVLTDLEPALNHSTEPADVRRAHARLFRMVSAGGATVINADDLVAEPLGAVNLEAHRVAFSVGGEAEVSAVVDRQDAGGTRFRLRGFEREATVDLRLVGPGTVSQALAAAAVAWSRGLSAFDVAAGLEAVTQIPGHLEAVREGQAFDIWLDAARTELQLHDILTWIRTTCSGLIHCVLSAEVPSSERLGLARTAERQGDRVILSFDDPRVHGPNEVLDDFLAKFHRPGRVRIEPDRRRAIETTLALAARGDTVLIAGGRRRAIAILDQKPVACDDRALATAWIRQNLPSPRRRSA